jgi:hypothetical protein
MGAASARRNHLLSVGRPAAKSRHQANRYRQRQTPHRIAPYRAAEARHRARPQAWIADHRRRRIQLPSRSARNACNRVGALAAGAPNRIGGGLQRVRRPVADFFRFSLIAFRLDATVFIVCSF